MIWKDEPDPNKLKGGPQPIPTQDSDQNLQVFLSWYWKLACFPPVAQMIFEEHGN